MNLENLANELVESGADVLTVVKPDWLDRMPLNLDQLNFIDPEACPLYYTFGDFLTGDRVLVQHGYYRLGAYGFAHPEELNNVGTINVLAGYDTINRAWRKLIAERRGDQS